MSVVPFPISRAVIRAAFVRETRFEGSYGVIVHRHDPPGWMYFVDIEDADGTFPAWDGRRHDDALRAARELLADGSAAALLDLTGRRP